MNSRTAIAACIATAAATSAAHAGYVVVDELGGPVVMNAGTFGGLLNAAPNTITLSELLDIHNSVNSAGIQTDGYVTFLLADTAAGLTFISLIDQPITAVNGANPDSSLGLSTTAPDSLNWFVHADGNDDVQWHDLMNGTQLHSNMFHWAGEFEGHAHAWGGLSEGDYVSYHFFDLGAAALTPTPFQFLSYGAQGWEVVATAGFSSNDQFVFSFHAVPSPGVAVMLAIGLTCSARRRRH